MLRADGERSRGDDGDDFPSDVAETEAEEVESVGVPLRLQVRVMDNSGSEISAGLTRLRSTSAVTVVVEADESV